MPEPQQQEVVGEARWPSACAVVAAILLTFLLPEELLPLKWVLPPIEVALLIAMIIGDPGEISRRSNLLRGLSIGLVSVLVFGAVLSTGHLIADLIDGGAATDTAGELIEVGGIVWVSNVIAFSLLYWEVDGGGAAARALGEATEMDFAFPQQLTPEVARSSWRPGYFDYLYLGFTNATAFSPTDAMPLSHRVKLAMAAQATISLAILGLVIARAVNVLS